MKFINNCSFEKIHIQFCKMLLGVIRQTSNIATRAEIGGFPLITEVYVSIIKYWLRPIITSGRCSKHEYELAI